MYSVPEFTKMLPGSGYCHARAIARGQGQDHHLNMSCHTRGNSVTRCFSGIHCAAHRYTWINPSLQCFILRWYASLTRCQVSPGWSDVGSITLVYLHFDCSLHSHPASIKHDRLLTGGDQLGCATSAYANAVHFWVLRCRVWV